MVIGVSGIA